MLPRTNDIIVFSRVPTGSYCLPNEEYRVTRHGNTFEFRSVERGSATQDRLWAVKQSKFTIIEKPEYNENGEIVNC